MEELSTQGPVFLIEVDKIVPNPQQPRREFDESALRELASSIREVGILQPVVVSKIETETEFGTTVQYQLIAGERRCLASKMLGLERVPAIIKQVSLERERLELALIENIQRENLNPIEEARAFSRFQDDFGMTQRELATRIGKSREAVANTLRLLNLPTEIQDAVSSGKLNGSQARLLLSIEDQKEQKLLFDEVMERNLSVRQLRDRIKTTKHTEPESDNKKEVSPEIIKIQKDLEEILGTKVKLEESGGSGKITISFFSAEELRGIIEKLTIEEMNKGLGKQFSLGTEYESSTTAEQHNNDHNSGHDIDQDHDNNNTYGL